MSTGGTVCSTNRSISASAWRARNLWSHKRAKPTTKASGKEKPGKSKTYNLAKERFDKCLLFCDRKALWEAGSKSFHAGTKGRTLLLQLFLERMWICISSQELHKLCYY